MGNIANMILNADEIFLVTLSNKGIYNRALKEYEESVTNIEIGDDIIKAEFSDGTSVSVSDAIKNYKCTCPSRTVCKHLIMTVLSAQSKIKSSAASAAEDKDSKESSGESEPAEKTELPDFDFISNMTYQQIEKLAPKKILAEAMFNIKMGSKSDINISSVLSVTINNGADNNSGQTVRFLPANGVIKTAAELSGWAGDSVCTCKASNFCAHKMEALLHFIIYKKGDDFFKKEFVSDNSGAEQNVEFGAYIIPYIKKFARDILSSGLARNSDSVSQRFLQLSTICHSQNLANMERSCDRIAGQYELFEKKSAVFSIDYLMSELCGLISQCVALEKSENGAAGKNIVGVFREQYNQIAPSEFYGLGTYGWHSSGGYTGVTAMFYSPELSDIAAYTTAMPDATAPPPDALRMYNGSAPWNMTIKLHDISGIKFTLKNAKINSRNNISSSNETIAQIQGRMDIFEDKLSKVRYVNFASLVENLWEKHSDEENQSRSFYAVVCPEKYEKPGFDSINQIYYFAVSDNAGRKINVSVKYAPSTALLIENLKKLEDRKAVYGPIFLRIYIENGKLQAFPISVYIKDGDGKTGGEFEVINLSLDNLDKRKPKDGKDDNKNKSKYFNW